jgi:hypothetical protein
MQQIILSSHVQQAEEAWAAKLQLQVHAWSAGRSERRSLTDSGVFVVRRPKKGPSSLKGLHSGGVRTSC